MYRDNEGENVRGGEGGERRKEKGERRGD